MKPARSFPLQMHPFIPKPSFPISCQLVLNSSSSSNCAGESTPYYFEGTFVTGTQECEATALHVTESHHYCGLTARRTVSQTWQ
jgi:hypothetical protein